MHKSRTALRAALLLLASCGSIIPGAGAPAFAALPESPLARQVDHIIIQSDQPEAVFKFLSEVLGLPTAWPFQSYGDFSSGAVNLGNVALEVIHLKDRQPGFTGIALEPAIAESVPKLVRDLDVRGLEHEAPEPTSQKDRSGRDQLAWTIVELRKLPPAGAIFFCRYAYDVDPSRAKAAQALEASEGGSLGVESVDEVRIGVRDIAASRRSWSLILGPPQKSGQESIWKLGSGPHIRLVEASEDGIAAVYVRVKSINVSRTFLAGKKLLALDSGSEVALDPLRTSGAQIRFIE